MRRVLFAAAIAAALLGTQDASAQVKLRLQVAPRIMNGPVIRAPVIRVIPPSMALNRAMMLVPQSQALGVKLKGGLYIVKLKQGNTIRQVHVDAATGDVSQ
ncbi:MAG: hypothetical protein ACREVW_16955 [Burkholderiales bacterium]